MALSLPIALSPCPNDTFFIHAWAHQLIATTLNCSLHFADIEQLNEAALQGRYPVSKISIGFLPEVLSTYQLLQVGAALGEGSGPKIIAKESFPLEELKNKVLAIPGERTTANLLVSRLNLKAKAKIPLLYSSILEAVDRGDVDCGLIIHESRFFYQERGFVEIADIGALFEQAYGCPVPLGGFIAKRSLGAERIAEIERHLQASLAFAWQNRLSQKDADAKEFILRYSQEKDLKVVEQHIDLFVNDETYQLSDKGREAILTLLQGKDPF